MAMYFSMNEFKMVSKILKSNLSVVFGFAILITLLFLKRMMFHYVDIIPDPILKWIRILSDKSNIAPINIINC
jgi:hypothetical protein